MNSMVTASESKNSLTWKRLGEVLALTAIYVLTAKIGLLVALPPGYSTTIWPPSGIALAAILMRGYTLWPGVFLGSFIINLWLSINASAALFPAIGATFFVAAGSSIQALLGAFVIQRFIGPSDQLFEKSSSVFRFVGFESLVCLIATTVGTTSLALFGSIPGEAYLPVWWTWWVGDLVGVLVFTPLVMASGRETLFKWTSWRVVEFLALFVLCTAVGRIIFEDVARVNYLMAYALIPFLIWCAFRFSIREVTILTFSFSAIVFVGMAAHFGPFAGPITTESVFLLQGFIGIITIMGLAMTIEVHQRKRLYEDYQKTYDRFMGIYKSSKDAIEYSTLDGVLIDVNEAFLKLTGYTKEELIHRRKYQDLTPQKYHEFDEKVVSEILRTGQFAEYEKEYMRKDGSNVPILLTVFVVKGSDGQPVGLAAIIKDMSERTLIEHTRAKLAAIVESSDDAIISEDLDGIITSWNLAAERLYGYTAEEAIGRHISLIVAPEKIDEISQIVDRLKKGEKTFHHDTLWMNKEGSPMDISLTVSPIKDHMGAIVGFSAISRDISDRKRVEQIKSEFVSTITHELRTPLTSIQASMELLKQSIGPNLSDKSRNLMEIAGRNSERLLRLVNDILDTKKLESGKVDFVFKPVNLMSLVQHAIESNKLYAEQFGVSYQLDSEVSGIKVNVDSDRLLQVLTNLLSNAAKFSPRGEKVNVSVSKNEDKIRITVTDHGPGIAPEIQARIFQKFSQASSAKYRRGGGTGLGLWISKALVEGLGGEIGFISHPGSETSFYVDLPEWYESAETPQKTNHDHGNILICEDEKDVATILSMILIEDGFSTDIAYNLSQAKHMLNQKPYSMMTMDLALPDGDGISLIRELRKQNETRRLPIIVVSAKAQQTLRDLGKEAEKYDVLDWIDKPIHTQHFLATVRSALQK